MCKDKQYFHREIIVRLFTSAKQLSFFFIGTCHIFDKTTTYYKA